ncbi:hypothetical protein [Bdellovibrio sp. HCB-162]|uniref:hypothetical protein n=1 Tax=Bdellovibrio sp. HCB-162 TaxID=3394234 RepID=UPI0039BD5E8B
MLKYLSFIVISVFYLEISASTLACPDGQYPVKAHYRHSYYRASGTLVRATNVKAHCKLLTRGYIYTKNRFKDGLPQGWPHSKERAKAWKDGEKSVLIDILDNLPQEILSEKIEGFYRAERSKDYPNPASSSDGIIVIYDSAFDNKDGLDRVITHELSHQNYEDIGETARQDYRRATGWHLELEKDNKYYWQGRKNGYVEEDGKMSPNEDYSNNFEHFINNPDKLKKTTPSAYEWYQKRYGDKLGRKGSGK